MSLGRIFIVLLVVGGLAYGLHSYLIQRLVRDPGLEGLFATAATGLLWTLFFVLFLGFFLARAPRALAQPVAWVSFTWMGFAFLLFVALLSGDLLKLALALYGKLAGNPPIDEVRRQFLSRVVSGGAALLATGVGVAGVRAARAPVALKHVQIALKGLDARARGYRIVQLSDVHIGPTIGHDWLTEVVSRVNGAKPDLVVITGDLVDGSVTDLAAHVAPLANLQAKDGVYFVTGNHEYYSGADEWLAHLATLGVQSLRNASISLEHFHLAGVDDATAFGPGHGADYTAALSGLTGAPVVLLAHQPRQIAEAAKIGVDLLLSGHTHGGQIAPFQYLVPLQQPYVAGLYRHDERAQVYVSRGTGYWGPPLRVGAPAEISVLELHPA